VTWPLVNFADATPYQQIFDYGASPNGAPVYIGWATCGAPTSQAVWKIQKLTYSTIVVSGSNVVVVSQKQYADGDVGFRHVWDNRASFAYK
jgi:hypothetical protein